MVTIFVTEIFTWRQKIAMSSNHDLNYIESIRQGNKNAYSFLVDKYKHKVYKLAIGILKEDAEAQDAAQVVFVKAYEKLWQFKGESGFATWLFRITYNECISRKRSASPLNNATDVHNQNLIVDQKKSVYDEVVNADRRIYINKCLKKLPEKERELIVLYYFNQLSIEEIATIVDKSVTNIKTILFRARKKMLDLLQHLLKDEVKELL